MPRARRGAHGRVAAGVDVPQGLHVVERAATDLRDRVAVNVEVRQRR